jgi:hypothetical protein
MASIILIAIVLITCHAPDAYQTDCQRAIYPPMTKDDLRAWLRDHNLTRGEAAEKLGLSIPALDHKLNGYSPVGRQTARIVELIGPAYRPTF